MSEARTALGGAVYEGYATVAEAPLQGMITLRGDLTDASLVAAATAATGAAMPGTRQITTAAEGALAWMSPDELLLLVPHAQAPAITRTLSDALSGIHAMAVEVSDARAVFTVSGVGAREVLSKLCPVDLAPGRFAPGEIRRTRIAQVPAAFWMSTPDEFTVVCFRSVAQYVFDLLRQSAQPGGEVGIFA